MPPTARWALFLAVLTACATLFVLVGQMPAQRVGDGNEYYALFFAWTETQRPWMTQSAYEVFQAFFNSGEVSVLVPAESLQLQFARLQVNHTGDFNHFWFYSLLAAICSGLAHSLGIGLDTHDSFLVLHFLLLSGMLWVAFRHFGLTGLAVVLVMTFASPMVWFIDKVHTEFFTFCLATTAVVLFAARRNVASAVLLAMTSTQNPSFTVVAMVPLAWRALAEWKRPYTVFEVAGIATTALLVLVHPVYYFARLGVVTPQLALAGITKDNSVFISFIWLFDPDVGLLPNWPLGTALLIVSVWALIAQLNTARLGWRYLSFASVYLLVSFYFQSLTGNLNSGATPGLARYATWYMPLLFPLVHQLFVFARQRIPVAVGLGLAIVLGGVYTAIDAAPRQFGKYVVPSMSSKFIQTRMPWLYDPPPEIFAERYSGIGEGIRRSTVRGVLGPDCRKLLVLPYPDRRDVTASEECQSKLDEAREAVLNVTDPKPVYLRLDD